MTLLALLALLAWIYLYLLHGQFWQSGPELAPARPATAVPVDIIVPARDEAETIGAVVQSLLAQDYAGPFRVILVDDGSTDRTGDIAIRAANGDPRFALLRGGEKPAGWSGKLWALEQGVAHGAAPVLLFTDADIVHDPRHLATLAARLVTPERGARLDMVSEMVRLNCESAAERALVPAFVYFFQMLYPFARVNDPLDGTAAAAGGTVLIRREALERAGGLAAMHGALIDDVTLAGRVKRGGAVFLGHSGLARSIRPYPRLADIRAMISRTAFTQLHYSGLLLALTLAGLAVVWLVPPLALVFGHEVAALCGLIASLLAVLSYQPTLRRYGRGWYWGLALPLIALVYMEATLASALRYWRGTGAAWKSRDYGADA
ncbi:MULTISPECIES: glycosyltransferase [Acidiphilium]|jgi:hopene-associated glycosyltransferase HpnB|uniref:Glycosyl transferase, family 2 n=1 Tax=Acidiphilium cryptum (strain JF-5) TaxID=349163 RepID=A5FUR6_ACICJ|nr:MULTISPECIES: glycosyltransferase [Acidiphilium]ABQ29348.1 glycosyl transferase, family 2 [Acidiphilium cryptum JF-5]